MDQIELDPAAVKSGALNWLGANKWWLAAIGAAFLLGVVV